MEINFGESKMDESVKGVKRLLEIIDEHCDNIENVLDIGACIGVFSTLVGETYPDANIWSYEPVLSSYKLLEENTRDNKNINCYNYGFYKNGQFPLGVPPNRNKVGKNNDGLYSVFHGNQEEVVYAWFKERIDDRNLPKVIDLVKLDTEGCETIIIENNIEFFKERVRFILKENSGSKELNKILIDAGFIMVHKDANDSLWRNENENNS